MRKSLRKASKQQPAQQQPAQQEPAQHQTSDEQLELVFEPGGPVGAVVRANDLVAAAQGRDIAEVTAEFAPWEATSTFLAVLDPSGAVAGTLRVITPGPLGLKSLTEAGGPPHWIDGARAARAAGIDEASCWDVGAPAVPTGPRQTAVTAALYHGLFLALRVNHVRSVILTADRVRRAQLAAIGLNLFPLPGTVATDEHDATPLYSPVVQLLDGQRRDNPEAHRLIARGIGLDTVHVPPTGHFLLRPQEALTEALRIA